ncbi:hypothetical protein JKF63_07757 [Porcisia hertigi]|uniref:YbaK/aminoacyl-tRNA synthetase-associated domain-containing protein n=1 Tax=Porcisia hertigi TaxID=2761500 RepID=A0A836LLV7_9TRYP|nr:hypothetical protein JKF63_07757 [Porcisia hertigi]
MERCTQYFAEKGALFLLDRIREFDESSATVELAATRLNCDAAHIAKSLSFLQKKTMNKAEVKARQKKIAEARKQGHDVTGAAESEVTNAWATDSPLGDSQIAVIVTAGDAKVNTKKYKEKFACQPHMLKREMVESSTGFPPGGVCPFGLNDNVKVYLDVSLKRFPYVYPAVGTANSGIKITPDELEQYASNLIEWVDLCEGWQPAEGAAASTAEKAAMDSKSTTGVVKDRDTASKKAENEALMSAETTV